MRKCIVCSKNLTTRHQIKYCSNLCQADYRYKQFLILYSSGEKNGSIGINVRSISGHLKRYLKEKYGNKCFECGWKKKHPTTGRVPIEIDHIDGNAENNKESNLRLLCPNCHALTPYFRNLNKGSGRKWRKDKYLKQ